MIVCYASGYHVASIGDHVFPMLKYEAIYRRLQAAGGFTFVQPQPAAWEELALVHTAEHLRKARTSTFSPQEIRRLELPWSHEGMEQLRLMVGGTLEAARRALDPASAGIVGNIGGGFHHAFADHGEGFCLFNDVAVAIRALQRDRLIARAAVIDCDAHHGNGTAAFFRGDASVFTFSMHALDNYPAAKPKGSLDIGLRRGTADDEYLSLLRGALPTVLASKPDMAFYVAGGDVFHGDRIGGLSLTNDGARGRDREVFEACRGAGVPVVVVLAGGYPRTLEDLVEIQTGTFLEARSLITTHRGAEVTHRSEVTRCATSR